MTDETFTEIKKIETQRDGMELIRFGMNMWENNNFDCKESINKMIVDRWKNIMRKLR